MSNPSLVVVLAEDQRHQRFIRKFLYKRGLSPHQIRFEKLPASRGCGEQWVRQQYAAAVRAYRQRSARAASALVVMIDADTRSVAERCGQLRDALQQASESHRSIEDAILHFIPKRNVETWVLFLHGTEVDEETDYSKRPEVDEALRDAGSHFFELTRPGAPVPEELITSLAAAITEIRRLERVKAG